MQEARAWKDGFDKAGLDSAGLGLCNKQGAIFLAVAGGLERTYAVGMGWGAPSGQRAKAPSRKKTSPSGAGDGASTSTTSERKQAATTPGTVPGPATVQTSEDTGGTYPS